MSRILKDESLVTREEASRADVVVVAGTSYTFDDTDAFKTIETTNAADVTLTIPNNSTVAYPIGTVIFVEQWGAGQVIFDVAGGVTLRSEAGADRITAQYASAAIRKHGTNEWILSGRVTT